MLAGSHGVAGGPVIALTAIALVGAAVAFGVRYLPTGAWFSSPSQSAARGELTELVAAIGPQRVIEARPGGGFVWAPAGGQSNAAAGMAAGRRLQARARIAAAVDTLGRNAAAVPDSAMASAALGVAYLVTGEPAKAVDALEEARDRQPGDARILSDLSAAYLTRGQAQKTVQDVARALDAAERSVTADPALLEAWFNRALALEHHHLDSAARAGWTDYITRDPSSPWAGEARTRIAALGRRPKPIDRALLERTGGELPADARERLALDASAARDFIDNDVLPRWAAAAIAAQGSNTDADAAPLQKAARLAALVAEVGGDRYLRDTIDSLLDAGRLPRQRIELARGIEAFLAARRFTDRADSAAAAAPLSLARRHLASVPSLQLHVELYRLGAAVQAGSRDEMMLGLERLERQASERGYLYLAARASLVSGLLQFRITRFTPAMMAFSRASDGFRRARETPFLATALAYDSEALSALGEHERAWASLVEAFSLLDNVSDFRRRHSVLISGGLLPLQTGLAGAALHVQRAALDNAEQWKVAASHVAARLQLARSFSRLGRSADARTVLAEAETWVARVSDASVREQYAIELALARGDVAAAGGDPSTAIAAYGEALKGSGAMQFWHRLSPIHLKRGRAHAAKQDWTAAERDWRDGLALVEQQRRSLREEELRIAHLDELWDLYGSLIELEGVQRGRAKEALGLVERGRARVLLESMKSGSAARGLTPAIASGEPPQTPPGVTAVVYATLERRLLIWVVSGGDVHMEVVDIPRVTLQRLIATFRDRMREPAAIGESSRRLYAALWAPIASRLEGRSSVVIIPDAALAMAPFAALDDRGTYLVERHALSLSPSLATLRIASDRLAALASRAGGSHAASDGTRSRVSRSRVLIAADPAIDRSIYPDLPALRAAREEADGIAALYEGVATVLRGTEVTKAKLIAGLEDADVLHFAGHAISSSLRPDDAFLVVAASADPAHSTRLEAAEIARLRLARFRMVLLSACHTAAGRAMRGEGMLNLARPFLVAGAPTVVATLSAVDDYTARDMMLEFHRRLRAGDAPDIALQRVQVERLRAARAQTAPPASSPPSTVPTTLAWADFVVVGAAHQPHRP